MEWRRTDDPYRIWVSEIMLQQTRVETVAPYYRRFLAAFPTVSALAAASSERVLKLWEGLGYYSRARNLHLAARRIAREHGGRLPDEPAALAALPGIGRSTAGAIAAIAFRRDAAILDANAARVLARLVGVTEDLSRSVARRLLWDVSAGLIAPGTGRETALALMDLGATVCIPRRPRCPDCPLRSLCDALRFGLTEAIPARRAKEVVPHHEVVAAWIEDSRGRVLAGRRPDRGLLGGLWEFPGGRRLSGESLTETLRKRVREEWGIDLSVGTRIGSLPHAFSHFRITLHAYRCSLTGGNPRPDRPWRWLSAEELARTAFPRVYRKLIETAAPPVRGRRAPSRSCSRAPFRTRKGGRRSS